MVGHTVWAEFRERYIDEGLAGLTDGTIAQASATRNRVESLIGPKNVQVLAREDTLAKRGATKSSDNAESSDNSSDKWAKSAGEKPSQSP